MPVYLQINGNREEMLISAKQKLRKIWLREFSVKTRLVVLHLKFLPNLRKHENLRILKTIFTIGAKCVLILNNQTGFNDSIKLSTIYSIVSEDTTSLFTTVEEIDLSVDVPLKNFLIRKVQKISLFSTSSELTPLVKSVYGQIMKEDGKKLSLDKVGIFHLESSDEEKEKKRIFVVDLKEIGGKVTRITVYKGSKLDFIERALVGYSLIRRRAPKYIFKGRILNHHQPLVIQGVSQGSRIYYVGRF